MIAINIRVDLDTNIQNGTEIVFRSPIDCSEVSGLIVYYKNGEIDEDKEFLFADAHGEDVGNIDHLFGEGAVVNVILDVTTSRAFVQNAATSAYLESKLAELDNKIDASGIDMEEVVSAVIAALPVYNGEILEVTE